MVHICRHCCWQIILKSLEYDYHEMCLRIIIDATTNASSHFQPHITRLNNWSICQNVRLFQNLLKIHTQKVHNILKGAEKKARHNDKRKINI